MARANQDVVDFAFSAECQQVRYLLSDKVVALFILEELVHLDDIGVILQTCKRASTLAG